MPNWVENDLLISGPDVLFVLNAIKGDTEAGPTALDFTKILPEPPLKNVEYGSLKSTIADAIVGNDRAGLARMVGCKWTRQTADSAIQELCAAFGWDLAEVTELGKQRAENSRLYHYSDLRGWRHANWGFDTNACVTQGPLWIAREGQESNHTQAKITFKTGLRPADVLIQSLATKFPDHSFELRYLAREDCFGGTERWVLGNVVEDTRTQFSPCCSGAVVSKTDYHSGTHTSPLAMPNCELYVAGPHVYAVLDAIKGESPYEPDLIDFNRILPVPPSLLDVEYPGADEIADVIATNGWDALGGKYDYEWAENAIVGIPEQLYLARGYDVDEISKLVNQRRENIRLHGHPNSFKWCEANWGTGYNASNSEGPFWIADGSTYPRIPIALIVFQAASKPLPVVQALAAQFPDHTFEFRYFGWFDEYSGRVRYERTMQHNALDAATAEITDEDIPF